MAFRDAQGLWDGLGISYTGAICFEVGSSEQHALRRTSSWRDTSESQY